LTGIGQIIKGMDQGLIIRHKQPPDVRMLFTKYSLKCSNLNFFVHAFALGHFA